MWKMAMFFKKEKQICVLNLDGHFLTLRHFERPRNGRQPQLAVEPSVLETRSQEEVIAFFFSYWHTLFDLCFSFFLSFSKALCDHFRNWWTFFSYSLCAQPVVVEFWTRISDIESECSRAVCLICLDILFKRIKELYVRLTWRIKSFLYFMAWHIIGFKLLPLLISVDHFSILVEALELLPVLTDHPWQ